jgi:hypothetical protein
MATKKLNFSLRLRHDTDDLSVLTQQLGLASEIGWNKGDQRLSLKGLPREGQRESSYRSFPLGVVTDVDVEEALPEYLQRLIPFSSALQSFVDSGGMASITIGWFGDSEVGGGRISADAVADMAKMHLTLDLYLYFEPIASNEAEADS